jgi:hypothetical protein
MPSPKTKPLQKLTKELIASTPTPLKGEVWLADSVVKGFGVRIWRNRSGARGMSYAVRAKDRREKWVRRKIDVQIHIKLRWALLVRRTDEEAAFYEALKYAREAAREEISRIKGRMTAPERRLAKSQARRKAQLEQTCKQAFDSLIQKAQSEGKSADYVHRLDKVFYQYIPQKLLEKQLKDISADDLMPIFRDITIPTSSFKILQMVAGRVFSLNHMVSGAKLRIGNDEDIDYVKISALRVPQEQIPDFSELENVVFERLQRELVHRVDALCLSVYFGTAGNNVPLSTIINATWHNIWSSKKPSFKQPSEMYWRYNPANTGKRVVITNEFATLLIRVLENSDGSSFWFPRNERGQKISFTRLSRFWKGLTQELGLPDASPVQYMRQWNKTSGVSNEFWSVMSRSWTASKDWQQLYGELFPGRSHSEMVS